jgi:hypothetical protein
LFLKSKYSATLHPESHRLAYLRPIRLTHVELLRFTCLIEHIWSLSLT